MAGMGGSIYRLRWCDLLVLVVLSLLLLGVLMVQSAATNVTGDPSFGWTERGTKHIIYAAIALAAFFAVGRMRPHRLIENQISPRQGVTPAAWVRVIGRPMTWLIAAAALSCALVLVPGIGAEVNGARRWIPLGIVQLQPSELAKWAIVVWLAWRLSHAAPEQTFVRFAVTLLLPGMLCLLVVVQDFGTAALLAGVTLCMLVAGRVRWLHLFAAVPPMVGAAVAFVVIEPYRLKRMTSFLRPFENPETEGYHMIQSLLSFSTGGIMGRGLGNGIQKLGYLPEDTTDFIFAVICEELGFPGALLTVGLYLGLLFVMWQTVRALGDESRPVVDSLAQADDDGRTREFVRLTAFGVGAMVCAQAVINIAVATVSVPTKGLSLPLVSAGGSGLIITCAALGLLYGAAKRADKAIESQDDNAAEVAPSQRTTSQHAQSPGTPAEGASSLGASSLGAPSLGV